MVTMSDEMRERWWRVGEEWLADHPVMDPPAGFELDPLAVGPIRGEDERSGWFLLGADPDEEVLYTLADLGPAARELVVATADYYPQVARIELWDGQNCVWAAKRSG